MIVFEWMMLGTMIAFWLLSLFNLMMTKMLRDEANANLALSIKCCAAFGEALALAGYGAHQEAINTLAPFVEMVEEADKRDRY